MSKRLRLTLLAVLVAAVLAGCGADEGAPTVTVAAPMTTLTLPLVSATAALMPTPAATPAAIADEPIAPATIIAPIPAPERPAEPLVPTVPAALALSSPAGSGALAAAAPSATVSAAPRSAATPSTVVSDSDRSRLGVGWANAVPQDPAVVQELGFGWYLDWTVQAEPLRVPGLEFAQMVLTRASTPFWGQRNRIAQAVHANPGALWLIGNEPDVPWQDNVTPEVYAQRYHQLYIYIKSLDPTARLAIGGVSQPTPLRMIYLERVLAAYEQLFNQPMPIDVWNVHAFVLREERDSWGVSIPPGFEDIDQGMLYEIDDNDDLAIFQQQLVDFRRWMARQGFRDWPLIVTEYGVLMPESYGFPPESVSAFMEGSFDFLLQARDPEIGYPADDNRLVQRFTWFSVGDTLYPTGNLIDPATGEITAVGRAFANYAARLDGARQE
jgi:hypothetical protein